MLAERLALSPDDRALRQQLAVIAERRSGMENDAFELGVSLFADKPKTFARRYRLAAGRNRPPLPGRLSPRFRTTDPPPRMAAARAGPSKPPSCRRPVAQGEPRRGMCRDNAPGLHPPRAGRDEVVTPRTVPPRGAERPV